MKKAVKFLALMICATVILGMTSCTEEENSNSSSGNSSGEIGNYTLGYYHPTKKIKKVLYQDHVGRSWKSLSFTWDGDNLETVIEEPSNITYYFYYNSNGYINKIVSQRQGYTNSHTTTIIYSRNTVEDPSSALKYQFDNNGTPTMLDDEPLSVLNGNISSYINATIRYDNKTNPFKNLIFPGIELELMLGYVYDDGSSILPTTLPFLLTLSNNNITGINDGGNHNIEYDGDYPVLISDGYGGIQTISIEYY